jgi:hypothetical protein
MKKTALTFSLLFGCSGFAAAQDKIAGSGKCGKADTEQAIEAGDRAGHVLAIAKYTCTWPTPFEMAGLQSKTYTVAEMSDVNGPKAQERGYAVITMDNGDKAFVRYQGTGAMAKDGKLESSEGTWSYTGGSGKLRGLTGKGTFKVKPTPGGGFEEQVEGECALPAKK